MQIHQLQRKNPNKKSKRIGRGGLRGKTSGRGHKGQKQHGGHGIRVELRDQIKKLPKLRGRDKNSNKSIHLDNAVVNIATLEIYFKDGDTVSPVSLKEKGVVSTVSVRKTNIKILGNGDLTKKLIIEDCLISQTAMDKISKAGGSMKS